MPAAGVTAAPAAVPDAPEEARAPVAKPEIKGLVWRVLGGVMGAAIVLMAITIYQHMQAQLAGLRAELAALSKETRRELGSLGERHGGLTKRADHDGRVRLIWDAIKELRTDRSDLGQLKERSGLLLDLYKAGESERRQLASDVGKLSEKKKTSDDQGLLRELRTLRERIAQLECAPKGKVTPVSHTEGENR
jgi:hypothetical protein